MTATRTGTASGRILCFTLGLLTASCGGGTPDRPPERAGSTRRGSEPPLIEARTRWHDAVIEAGAVGRLDELPPMLVVEGTSIGLILHNFSDAALCVAVARVADEERCPLGPPDDCSVVRAHDSREFVGAPQDTSGACATGALEFRVGKPFDTELVWWTDSALAEFAAETATLREAADEQALQSGRAELDEMKRQARWIERLELDVAGYREQAAIRREAMALAGLETLTPTRTDFQRALDRLRALNLDKLFADLEAAGAVGGPGEAPPMLTVTQSGDDVSVTNLTDARVNAHLKRVGDGGVRCLFEYDAGKIIDAGQTVAYHYSGDPRCAAGRLQFKVTSEHQDPSALQWWSQDAIDDFRATEARNAQLMRSDVDQRILAARSTPEVVGQMRHYPPMLNDQERAGRWREALRDLPRSN
jgi:hypothetical protein